MNGGIVAAIPARSRLGVTLPLQADPVLVDRE
jgi:hypothetical protein